MGLETDPDQAHLDAPDKRFLAPAGALAANLQTPGWNLRRRFALSVETKPAQHRPPKVRTQGPDT